MALDQYRKVIERVLAEQGCPDPAGATAELILTVKVAMKITGDLDLPDLPPPGTTSPVRIQTLSPPAARGLKPEPGLDKILTAEREFGASALIIGEAPPSAQGYANGAKPTVDYHTQDELTALAAANLPMSMQLQLPGFPKPIEIRRRLQPSPIQLQPEKDKETITGWVRIMYVIEGQEEGPTVQVFTTEENPNWKAIKNELAEQAAKLYRKDKVKIEAKVGPPPGMPTQDDLDRAADAERKASGGRDSFSGEDQKDAAGMRAAVEAGLRERGIPNVENWKPR